MGNIINLKENIIIGSNICEINNDSMTYADDGEFIQYQFANDIQSECYNILKSTKNKFIYMKIWYYQDIIFVIEQYCCSNYVKESDEMYILHNEYFNDN